MSDLATLATALVLGFLHALEIDHMLAVTAFMSRRPALATAAGFGLRWGIGHSLAVLGLGGILLATGISWPARWTSVGEAAVGVMLVVLGLWSLRATRNLHLHPAAEHGDHMHLHAHAAGPDGNTEGRKDGRSDHLHPGPHGHAHHHGRSLTLVGLAHGLAGTSAVVALVPVTMVGRTAVGIGYLLAFGLGVTVAMTLFAAGAALAMRQAAVQSLSLGRRVSTCVGWAGVVVGVWWILRAVR